MNRKADEEYPITSSRLGHDGQVKVIEHRYPDKGSTDSNNEHISDGYGGMIPLDKLGWKIFDGVRFEESVRNTSEAYMPGALIATSLPLARVETDVLQDTAMLLQIGFYRWDMLIHDAGAFRFHLHTIRTLLNRFAPKAQAITVWLTRGYFLCISTER